MSGTTKTITRSQQLLAKTMGEGDKQLSRAKSDAEAWRDLVSLTIATALVEISESLRLLKNQGLGAPERLHK